MYAEPPRFEILTRDGRFESPPWVAVLGARDDRFLSCAELAGVRVTLPAAATVASVRALLAPGGGSDVLNSWVRSLQLPPRGALTLDGIEAEERRFAVPADGAPGPRAALCELRLPPRTLQQVTLRLPPGPYGLLALSLHEAPYEGEPWRDEPVADLPAYPASQAALPRRGDPLAEALRAGGEPSLEALWRLALPYRGGALLGAPEGPLAEARWDGGVIVPDREDGFDRLWLKLDLGPASALGAALEQRLLDGWLPASVVSGGAAGWRLRQTALIEDGALHVRWEIEGDASAAPITPRLRAARARLAQAENGPQRRPAHEELSVSAPTEAAGAVSLGPLKGVLRPAPRPLQPGERAAFELRLPLRGPAGTGGSTSAAPGADDGAPGIPGAHDGAPASPGAHDGAGVALVADGQAAAESSLRRAWSAYLDGGAALDLPDPLLQDLWRALSVHNRLFIRGGQMRYGLFPGVYEDAIFGVEEGWNIVALALYGQGRLAEETLARTFFDREFLKKEGQHHQYRNGLALTYALDVFRLTANLPWLRGLYPTVLESAGWIEASLRSTRIEEGGARPVHFGLMPKHTYGGDLKDPTYSLYGSSACWRGLRDAGLIAGLLGDTDAAARLGAAAAQAREDMHRAAARIYKRDGQPPFLPFRVDEPGPEPSAGDYHQLFASLVLETALFGWQGELATGITDYLLQTGRQVAGVARFDQWFGRLGVDAEYSRGFQLAHLARRRFDDFWLGLVGQVGLSCDPRTFVSPETAVVRFDRRDHQDRMRELAQDIRRFDSDPCSAGTAVMLQYLRYLLLFEERDEDDLPTGTLWLAPAAPPSWFRPGVRFGGRGLPTAFGPVSLRCESSATETVYEIETARPVPVELFYLDGGRRRSSRAVVDGAARIALPRC